jgi:hypothetical protein
MRNYPCPLGRILGVNYWTDCPEFKSEDELKRHLITEHSVGAIADTLARIVGQSKPSKYRTTFIVNGRKMVNPYHYAETLEGRR